MASALTCANCNSSKILVFKHFYECCSCHHKMVKRKSKKQVLAAQATSYVSKTRKPSMPTLKFMENANDEPSTA